MAFVALSAYGAGKTKKDIVIARDQESITIDPQAGWDGASLIVMRQMYNQLLQVDNNMKIVPNLAESYKYLSGTQIQFKLRKGVKFHNGEEMKASDVKFSIQRAMASPKVKAFAASITEVKVVDDYTVVIVTEKPYAPLLANLCHTALSVVSEKAVKEMGDGFKDHPVGTGPFKFSQWVSGDKIVLLKHKDYFAGAVAADSLTFRTVPEGSSRTIALETGEVDMVYPVDPVDARRVASSKKMSLVETLSPKIEYVSMNQKFKPFSDVKVRRAINYAINRQAIFDVVAEGKGKITDSVMSAKIMGFNDKVTSYEYNPEKAKKLLAEAGYPNGFDVVISISGDMRNRNAQLIQSDLSAVGINATIENLEWATFLDKVNKGDYQIFNMSYNNTTGDPDTSLYQLFCSTVPAASGNRSFYKNPKIDELLLAGRLEVNIAKRMEIYKQIQQILSDDAVWIPLYSIANLFGLRADLKGFDPHPLANDIFNTLHY
jgi:peptide/nickel transport system substrate-binding protein